jgi:hypothetical protein
MSVGFSVAGCSETYGLPYQIPACFERIHARPDPERHHRLSIGVGDAVADQLFWHRPVAPPEHYSGLAFWLATVNRGLHETYAAYPWVAYGTDWLAFAHIAIAVYFIGPLINPLRNEWVLYAGLIGCALVLPLALICGPLRGIPLYWRLIDCSFGLFGAVPRLHCLHLTRLMQVTNKDQGRLKPT